jgi:aspartate oxidase
MTEKMSEIVNALIVRRPFTVACALHKLRGVVADILTAKDYRRLYELTMQVVPLIEEANEVETQFGVQFKPTRQDRDGNITQVGHFSLRIIGVDSTTGRQFELGHFKAVPLSQD